MKIKDRQRTVTRSGALSGIGLHSGEPCTVTVGPSTEGQGIIFFKDGVRLGSLSKNEVKAAKDSARCTALGEPPLQILTVEHFLAAVLGLGLCNLEVRVKGPELPALDGSALGFTRFLKKLGPKAQNAPRTVWRVREPIFFYGPGRAVQALPAESLNVSYVLDYDHAALRGQTADVTVTPDRFEKELAPARTFCTKDEADALKERGFGKGADVKNTLVMTARGPLRNRLRFKNECARHKALDLLGDLALLGVGLAGDFRGLRSGHGLNRRLVEEIRRQNEER